jgi:hypothetical protein
VKLNRGLDFINLDDILVDLKLTPDVLEIPVPKYYTEDRAKVRLAPGLEHIVASVLRMQGARHSAPNCICSGCVCEEYTVSQGASLVPMNGIWHVQGVLSLWPGAHLLQVHECVDQLSILSSCVLSVCTSLQLQNIWLLAFRAYRAGHPAVPYWLPCTNLTAKQVAIVHALSAN